MARLLTNGAPLAEDQQPISHRNNCENRNVKWKEVDVADMVAPLAEQQRHSKVIKAIKTSTCSQKIQGVHEGGYGKQKKWLECEMAVVGGLMEAGPLLVTTPPPPPRPSLSVNTPVSSLSILSIFLFASTVDPNDPNHSKVESINHRDKVFIGVFWRLYLKLLLSSMKKKETQWINHSNIRRWDVSKSFEIILLGDIVGQWAWWWVWPWLWILWDLCPTRVTDLLATTAPS